jgi:hypothetical protein
MMLETLGRVKYIGMISPMVCQHNIIIKSYFSGLMHNGLIQLIIYGKMEIKIIIFIAF